MSRKAGSGHQNIRHLENQAIASADRSLRRKRGTYTAADIGATGDKTKNNTNSNDSFWIYKMVNGKWCQVVIKSSQE